MYKCHLGIIKKNKERLQKMLLKDINIFLKKRETRGVNMLASDTEICLMENGKTEIMVANNIKIFLKMNKQGLVEYKKNYSKIGKNELLHL